MYVAGGTNCLVRSCDVSNNGSQGINVGSEIDIEGLVAWGGNPTYAIYAASGTYNFRLRGFSIQASVGSSWQALWLGLNVRAHLSGGHIQCDIPSATASLIVPQSGTVVYMDNLILDGSATTGTSGWYGSAGSTLRLGPNVKISSSFAHPFNFATGSYTSRGIVQASNASSVAVAFPDLTASDKVILTPTAVAGYMPFVTKTVGTGFTIQSTAGDTQVYDYRIL